VFVAVGPDSGSQYGNYSTLAAQPYLLSSRVFPYLLYVHMSKIHRFFPFAADIDTYAVSCSAKHCCLFHTKLEELPARHVTFQVFFSSFFSHTYSPSDFPPFVFSNLQMQRYVAPSVPTNLPSTIHIFTALKLSSFSPPTLESF